MDIEAAYQAHGKHCYSLAVRIVRDRHLAEDVVQDVFENLYRHPHRFDPTRGTLSAWLLALTHNRAVDVLRCRSRRVGRDSGDSLGLLSGLPDSGIRPDELACRSDQSRRVRAALATLTSTQREIIGLCYFGGQTQSEVATSLGIPLGTVKSRTTAGMHALRGAFAATR